ncbi:hypothetical protein ABVT39_013121 [Epinephelus coioides]
MAMEGMETPTESSLLAEIYAALGLSGAENVTEAARELLGDEVIDIRDPFLENIPDLECDLMLTVTSLESERDIILPETFKSLDKDVFKDLCQHWGSAQMVLVSMNQDEPRVDNYIASTFKCHLMTPAKRPNAISSRYHCICIHMKAAFKCSWERCFGTRPRNKICSSWTKAAESADLTSVPLESMAMEGMETPTESSLLAEIYAALRLSGAENVTEAAQELLGHEVIDIRDPFLEDIPDLECDLMLTVTSLESERDIILPETFKSLDKDVFKELCQHWGSAQMVLVSMNQDEPRVDNYIASTFKCHLMTPAKRPNAISSRYDCICIHMKAAFKCSWERCFGTRPRNKICSSRTKAAESADLTSVPLESMAMEGMETPTESSLLAEIYAALGLSGAENVTEAAQELLGHEVIDITDPFLEDIPDLECDLMLTVTSLESESDIILPETFKSLDKDVFKDLCQHWGSAQMVLVSMNQDEPRVDNYIASTFKCHLMTPAKRPNAISSRYDCICIHMKPAFKCSWERCFGTRPRDKICSSRTKAAESADLTSVPLESMAMEGMETPTESSLLAEIYAALGLSGAENVTEAAQELLGHEVIDITDPFLEDIPDLECDLMLPVTSLESESDIILPETFKSLDKDVFKELCQHWGSAQMVLVSMNQDEPRVDNYIASTFKCHLMTPAKRPNAISSRYHCICIHMKAAFKCSWERCFGTRPRDKICSSRTKAAESADLTSVPLESMAMEGMETPTESSLLAEIYAALGLSGAENVTEAARELLGHEVIDIRDPFLENIPDLECDLMLTVTSLESERDIILPETFKSLDKDVFKDLCQHWGSAQMVLVSVNQDEPRVDNYITSTFKCHLMTPAKRPNAISSRYHCICIHMKPAFRCSWERCFGTRPRNKICSSRTKAAESADLTSVPLESMAMEGMETPTESSLLAEIYAALGLSGAENVTEAARELLGDEVIDIRDPFLEDIPDLECDLMLTVTSLESERDISESNAPAVWAWKREQAQRDSESVSLTPALVVSEETAAEPEQDSQTNINKLSVRVLVQKLVSRTFQKAGMDTNPFLLADRLFDNTWAEIEEEDF